MMEIFAVLVCMHFGSDPEECRVDEIIFRSAEECQQAIKKYPRYNHDWEASHDTKFSCVSKTVPVWKPVKPEQEPHPPSSDAPPTKSPFSEGGWMEHAAPY
jgi:hypothetical protein